jgi:hypothetical protein
MRLVRCRNERNLCEYKQLHQSAAMKTDIPRSKLVGSEIRYVVRRSPSGFSRRTATSASVRRKRTGKRSSISVSETRWFSDRSRKLAGVTTFRQTNHRSELLCWSMACVATNAQTALTGRMATINRQHMASDMQGPRRTQKNYRLRNLLWLVPPALGHGRQHRGLVVGMGVLPFGRQSLRRFQMRKHPGIAASNDAGRWLRASVDVD